MKKIKITAERYKELLEKEKIADSDNSCELLMTLFRGKSEAEEEVRKLRRQLRKIHYESEVYDGRKKND